MQVWQRLFKNKPFFMLTYSNLCQASKHGHISVELGWLQGKYGTQKNYTILYFSVAYMQHKIPIG